MLKILVVTSCTGEKKYKPGNQLLQQDFQDPQLLKSRENELGDYKLKARDMYTGMQHLRLYEGVSMLRDKFGKNVVDVAIISAGYGLISEDEIIVPYEVTFNNMNNQEIVNWSRQLNIHNDLEQLVSNYDLIFYLLGDKYLRALELPINIEKEKQCHVFLASKTSDRLIQRGDLCCRIQVGQDDAKSFSYGLVGLKGYIFKCFAQEVEKEGLGLINDIYVDPANFLLCVDKYRKNSVQYQQSDLFPDMEQDIVKGKDKRSVEVFVPKAFAKNYGRAIRYFIPECDDRVDPNYDFITDTHTPGRNPYQHDVYAHEIFNKPNYDGLLVSKLNVESNKKKKKLIQEKGIHEFLRFPTSYPIIGDCGAFSYIGHENPPYETEEILQYYDDLGFNMGVSVDHLIVGKKIVNDPVERLRRFTITQKNAEDFLVKHRKGNHKFIPYGVAQGWDPESYRQSVGALIEMGYEHICLGGLARTPSKKIYEIVNRIAPIISENLEMHLFGVARVNAIENFRKMGVTSFDSASHLRRAWLGSSSNYFAMDGNEYAAIRVPQVTGQSVRVKKMVSEGRGTLEQFALMERNALDVLRLYDKGQVSLEETLETVLVYDDFVGDGRQAHADLYSHVLEDQPWKHCDCPICKECGIEVIIFRGNNRNRRRGFHNTYAFYKQFQDIILDRNA